MSSQKVYLIIGGGGFLGRYIVENLLSRGEKNVKIFDIRKSFEEDRVEFIIGDITKPEDLKKACKGVTTVIHTASPAVGVKGDYSYDLIYRVNVVGTKNVIEACIEMKVRQLIYTSSASVVFEGKDLRLANEETPYATQHLDPYSFTKV
jgi:sterol-4alpha-carboxylate 3-dehydrogenase (decarboxylating)